MPEGDTIYRAARAMQRVLAGKVVLGFQTGLAHLARVEDEATLVGRVVEKVEARGKWLLVYFSGDLILVTHMLMSGSWHLYRAGEKWWMGKDRMRAAIRVGGVAGPTHAKEPHEWGTPLYEGGTRVENVAGPTHAMKPHEWGTRVDEGGTRVDEGGVRVDEGGVRDRGAGEGGWEAVAFNVPIAEFHTARSLERSSQVPKLGPDLLSAEFTVEAGVARMREYGAANPEAEIAVVLLNQRVLAGLGNVYKSEVAFAVGVNPFRPMRTITEREMAEMVEVSQKYMKANVMDGSGDGIVTYSGNRRTTHAMDREERLWVYGRSGQECRRCGALVMTRKQGEQARTTFWCPVCQPWVEEGAAPVGRVVKKVGRRRKGSC